jgi:hypothetical protein
MRNAYKIVVVTPEGEKLFRRPGHRGENNITIALW